MSCNICGSIPGPRGATGDDGAAGSDGINAFTTTTANFTMPAESATVVVTVAQTGWASVGQTLYVQNAGYMSVSAIGGTTSITLTNLENTGSSLYTANVAPGTVVSSGAKISPGGVQGPAGGAGAAGTASPLTTKGDIWGYGAADERKAVGTNWQVLHANSADGQGIEWRDLDLAGTNTRITGIVPITNGGTGASSSTSAFANLAPASPSQGNLIVYNNAATWILLPTATNGKFLKTDSTVAAGLKWDTPTNTTPTVHLRERYVNGTPGAAATGATWDKRALNQVTTDTAALVSSLTAGVFVLAAGTYEVYGWAVNYKGNLNRIRIRNTTAGTTLVNGINAQADATANILSHAYLCGRFTVAAAQDLELQHFVATAHATGFGLAITASGEDELYAELFLKQVSVT